MSTTPDLGIPELSAQQAQPEVTHNEAVQVLSALQNGVIDQGRNTAPGSPAVGDAYVIGASPTGTWAGRAHSIAVYTTGGWRYCPDRDSAGSIITMGARQEGMRIWDRTLNDLYVWTGAAWQAFGSVGGVGDVTGPASAVASNFAQFDGTTGKLLKDAGISLDTDTALAADSDSRIPSQKAVKAFVGAYVAAQDVEVFKGGIDCSASPNYPAADAGHVYRVTVAGKIGGASGPNVEVNDRLECVVDGSASGTQAAVGTNWLISQVNIDGAVTGPASATDGRVALFDGATGKVIKDSGLTLAGTNTGDETVTTAGALINGATSKATPVDADYLGLMDSAASNVLKKLSWANLKATLKAYFDTLYAPLSQPFDIHTFYPGIPTASAKLYRGKLARAATFPANFAGAEFTATANATASTVFDIQKNGSSVGSCTIAAGTTTPTFVSSGGAAVNYAAGDVFACIAPASPDATLADPAITFPGTR